MVRMQLAVDRRAGVPFEEAWEYATRGAKYDHDTTHRREQKQALEDTKWAWELAWRREEIPGGPALAALADALALFEDRAPVAPPEWAGAKVSARKANPDGYRFNQRRAA
jgi:hypothetical protein